MKKHHPLSWLAARTQAVPTTLGKVVDRAVAQPARDARVAVSDAAPFGDGLEARLRRADAALERAQALEAEAAGKAVTAREAADEVDAVRTAGVDDVRRARQEADQRAEQVTAEARREADDYVAAKQQRARENADRDVAEVQQEADSRVESAEVRAERARTEAEQAVAQAREQMTEARRVAEEAAAAARAAADEARGRAEELSREADERVAEAEDRTQAVESEGRDLATAADTGPLDLDELTKAELVELARSIGLDVNGHRLKKELVTAIRRSRS